MPGTLHTCFSPSLTIALWGRLLSSLHWWVIGNLAKLSQGSQDSNWPGWLPSPHTPLCPLWPPINYISTQLTSQSRRDLPRELNVRVTWLWPCHTTDCQPIRLMWWPHIFFLPHLCARQALSCWLRQQEWPSLIRNDCSVVGLGGASSAAQWVLNLGAFCVP